MGARKAQPSARRFKQAAWGHAYYWAASRGEPAESYTDFLEREFPKGWRVISVQHHNSSMMSPPSVVVTACLEDGIAPVSECRGCDSTFVPSHGNSDFCTPRCGAAFRKRKQRDRQRARA